MTIKELSDEYYSQYEALEKTILLWRQEQRENPLADQSLLTRKIAMARRMATDCLQTSGRLMQYCRRVSGQAPD